MNVRLFSLLVCLPVLGAAAEGAPGTHIELPTPAGLQQCAPDDPVASVEVGVAEKLGGVYLGCFQSARRAPALPGVATSAQVPVEHGFALALGGSPYTPANLGRMLMTVRQQWKDYDALGTGLKESYIARLNDMIAGDGAVSSTKIVSVKPVLFAIDEGKENYYAVISIRTYAADANGQRFTITKVNADAVALQGARIVRLTIQRTLTDPSDVAQVRDEIANWARATAHSMPLSAP